MKTLAAVLVQLKKPLEIQELEIPPLKRGQVLVEMAYSGLCHSQLNEWKGAKGQDPYLPHTLGHEGSGTVLDIGEGVTKVKPTDKVVLSWIKGKGLDNPSTIYRSGNTTVNSGAISTFLEKAIVSENRVIPITESISLKEAALMGCAIPTGAGVVFNDMQIKAGQSIAIFGVGGIGSSAILAASYVQAFPIVAIDVHKEKLERAKILGATHVIHANTDDLDQKLSEIFERRGGADFALESAGRREVMEKAFQAIRPFGGRCIIAGNLPLGEKIQIDPFELIKGKSIIGTWGGSAKIDEDISKYSKMFTLKNNLLENLISHEIRLHEINELMVDLDKGLVARGLISFC